MLSHHTVMYLYTKMRAEQQISANLLLKRLHDNAGGFVDVSFWIFDVTCQEFWHIVIDYPPVILFIVDLLLG